MQADAPKSIQGKKQQQRNKRVEKAITAAQSLSELRNIAKHAQEGELAAKYAERYAQLSHIEISGP